MHVRCLLQADWIASGQQTLVGQTARSLGKDPCKHEQLWQEVKVT